MEEEEDCKCVDLLDGERFCDPVDCEQLPHNLITNDLLPCGELQTLNIIII